MANSCLNENVNTDTAIPGERQSEVAFTIADTSRLSTMSLAIDHLTLATHALLLLLAIAALLALRRWPWVFMLSIWPGTVAHELLHYAAGLMAGAQPVALNLLPRRKPEGGWVLGSVAFARLRWWNAVPVGLAPLALMPAGGWVFLQSTAWPLLSAESAGWKLVAVQCLVAGWPSPRDWAHAIVGLMVLAALAVGGYALWLKWPV